MFTVRHPGFFVTIICSIVPALLLYAQEPLLLVSGLPCPGGHGGASNAHPLIWNCLCAAEKGVHHDWWDWRASVPVHYGDVVTATWYNQCRGHATDWDFLRLDLVTTNGSGLYETNTSVVKMKAGHNFALCYVYWYTNNGSLVPTNTPLSQVPRPPSVKLANTNLLIRITSCNLAATNSSVYATKPAIIAINRDSGQSVPLSVLGQGNQNGDSQGGATFNLTTDGVWSYGLDTRVLGVGTFIFTFALPGGNQKAAIVVKK